MKILFLAFYFEPYPGVGSKRISYWAKNLIEFLPHAKIDVVTSSESKSPQKLRGIDNIHTVPIESKSFYSRIIKFDSGSSWYYPLKKFLCNNLTLDEYDYVIFTGNPYFHFPLASYIEKKGVRTILDFRDPMANNPRAVKATTLKRKVKYMCTRALETWLVSKSTRSIAVNQHCRMLIDKKVRHKVDVIDNGYDETAFNSLVPHVTQDECTIFYAGSLYSDRSPFVLISCLEKAGYTFHHFGPEFEGIRSGGNVIVHGVKSYEDVIESMRKLEVGVIFTSGHKFESTTKIFDYIALKKKILIVTEKVVRTGALHDITCSYPLVEWASNDSVSILSALERLRKMDSGFIDFDISQYSRKSGLKKLVKLLDENK